MAIRGKGLVLCAAVVASWVSGLVLNPPAMAADRADTDAAMRTYYSANGLLNRGLYDLAAAEYRSFLDAHPDHPQASVARYGLGVSLYRMERYDAAVDVLSSLRDQPEFAFSTEALTIAGQCHMARGAYESAAEYFDQVLRSHADHELADEAAVLLAEANYNSGRYEQVDRPSQMVIEQWADSPLRERAELFLGMARMARGEYVAASEQFEAMMERFPDGDYADQATLLLAQCLHRADAVQQAIEWYREVIRRAREAYLPDALYGLAAILHQQNQQDSAGRLLDRLLDEFPGSALNEDARLLRSRVWFDQDEFDQSLSVIQPLTAHDGRHRAEATYWDAKCRLRMGDADGAADRLGGAIERFPDSDLLPEMMFDRAVALLRTDEPEEALVVLGEFTTRYGKHTLSPDALQMMAATQHQLGRYDDSMATCRQFQQRQDAGPHAAAIAFLVGENAFLLNDDGAAVEAFSAYLRDYPDTPQNLDAIYRLGMAQHRLQEFDDAESTLEQIAKAAESTAAYRPALLVLGDHAFQRSDWNVAIERLEQYLAFGADQPSIDDALLKLGLARQRTGDPDGAIDAYTQLIDSFPESPRRLQAMFERGQVFAASGDTDEAIEAFEHVLESDRDSRFAVHALRHLGAIAAANEDYERAAEFFGRVAGADSTELPASEALFQQGQALMSAGRFQEASSVFQTLIEDHSDSEFIASARAQRAIALARLDEPEQALELIDTIRTENPDALDRELLIALTYEEAWCLRAIGRESEAASAYGRLLEADTSSSLQQHARLELAELHAAKGRHEAAVELLQPMVADVNAAGVDAELRAEAHHRLGICEFQQEHYRLAAQHLEQYIGARPDDPQVVSARLICGEALYNAGAYKRAIDYLQPVSDGDPADASWGAATLRLGECFAALQFWSRSERAFMDYLQRLPESDLWFQARFGVGWAQENQQRYDDAIQSYEAVVNRHVGPTTARAQFQIGECLFAQDRFEDAATELLKVDILYAYPDWSAAALYEAGRCFQALLQPDKARQLFTQVEEQHADTEWAQLATQQLASLATQAVPGH